MSDTTPDDEPEADNIIHLGYVPPPDRPTLLAAVLDALADLEAMPNATTAASVKAALDMVLQELGIAEVEEPRPTAQQSTDELCELLREQITAISARDGASGWEEDAADKRQDRVVYVGFQKEANRFIILIRPHADVWRGRKAQVNLPIESIAEILRGWIKTKSH